LCYSITIFSSRDGTILLPCYTVFWFTFLYSPSSEFSIVRKELLVERKEVGQFGVSRKGKRKTPVCGDVDGDEKERRRIG
jgi:hypothetical protein